MPLLALLNHALNFFAPALWLAIGLPTLALVFKRNRPLAPGFIAQAAIIFIGCAALLLAGLVLLGRDGHMLTYAAVVAAAASVQAFMTRAKTGRRGR
jgi:hypothetical protein